MLKEINLHQAIDACTREKSVWKLTPVTLDDTIRELSGAHFIIYEEEEEKPQKEKKVKSEKKADKKIDHGKIVALWRAKWTTNAIADEIGCSEQTVINHLKQEGLK